MGLSAFAGGHPQVREVDLEVQRTSAKYRQLLHDALVLLKLWISQSRWWDTSWEDNGMLASQILCEHVQWLRDTGRGISAGRHAILSAQTAFRCLKGCLGRAWDCISSWKLQCPLRSRIPMPLLIMQAMFLMSIANGLTAMRNSERLAAFSFAVLVRLGHHCLLRPGEILKLVVADIRLPNARASAAQGEPEVAILRLRDPKNKASLGRFQFALVKDISIVRWLAWLVSDCPPEMRLWPGDGRRFSLLFRQTLSSMGLTRFGLTPGSLRPGGATLAFMSGSTVSELKYRGRWKVESSLEVYIQEAMSHLCVCELADHEHSVLTHMLSMGVSQWQQPPALPWGHFFSRSQQWRGLALWQSQANRSRQPQSILRNF